jgi:WD40 repeat protein/DNA-binding SARP family transcriptional activator
MHVGILGPTQASVDGRPLALGGGKPRALLAMLALRAGSTVSMEQLVEGLWGERVPATAAKMVQLYVSQLRKTLAAGGDGAQIVTHGRGYELRVGPDDVDLQRFERLMAGGAPREALALWRGPPLDDVAGEPFAPPEIRRLEELRLAAVELAIEQDLDSGRHREVVAELEALVAQAPLRERLHGLRMLALYRSGRQGDALEAYREARAALVEQIGVEPGPELRRLHKAILHQDPALELTPQDPVTPCPELETRTPLVGREAELELLREFWQRSAAGSGRLVVLVGPAKIGKTRLAAELALDAQRCAGAVHYATGAGPRETALEALAAVRAAQRPTLVVLDDLDRAPNVVRAALDDLGDALAERPVLVLATAAFADVSAADATLSLGPLAADGVREVARRYAGSRSDADVPVQQILAASGGVPGLVHRVAREWARGEAARRRAATAQRAAAGRAGLRAAEDELADEVAELQAARDQAESDDGGSGVVVCPFKGLASFDVEDAEVFFGREQLVAEMVARLAGAPVLGIVGPSGSGKSSALRAGLLAALAAGVLPGSEGWGLALLRPGEHPVHALDRAVADAGSHRRTVVAVDQFEEVFTACRDPAEREAFVEALLASARDPLRRAVVLIAVRADFYGRCAAYPELARLLGSNHVLVGPMGRAELRRAIELPAQRAGLRVDPELTDALVADVDGEPGPLPLLSTALLELWQQRDGRRLRLSAYQQAGGVHGAVARLAEHAYERLDPARRDAARMLLMRLAGEGQGDAVVRRRVALDDLASDAESAAALAALADARLITISDDEVEVAHEALLREWPRLRAWLEEDAEGRRLHHHLHAAAKDWEAGGRDTGELLRGARLASTLDWATAHRRELSDLEHGFLETSRTASERAHRRLQVALAGVVGLLLLAVVAGVVALGERGNARHEATVAQAQRLGALALVENDLDRSLLLAVQGLALDDSVQTRGNLLAALVKSPAAIGVVRGNGDRLVALDLSPDGGTLAVVHEDGTTTFLDTRTRRPVGPSYRLPDVHDIRDTPARWYGLRFSPDGERIAVGLHEPVILDARTRRVLVRLRLSARHPVHALRFSGDGRSVFATYWSDEAVAPCRSRAVLCPSPASVWLRRFDAATGQARSPERRIGGPTTVPISLMIAAHRGQVVTTFSDRTVIRDARTLRPVRRLAAGAQQAALSPDERTLLLGGGDGSVRFADLVTGVVRTASGRHEREVAQAAFSTDGRTAVTAGADGRILVWDVARAAAAESFAGHTGQINGLAISRDDSRLYTASREGIIVIWDLGGARRLGRRFRTGPDDPQDFLPRYALSSDGLVLATGHADGTVTLIDPRTLTSSAPLRVIPRDGLPGMRSVTGMGFVPGTHLLVVGGEAGFLGLVDVRRGRLVARLRGHDGPVYTPSFSADGHVMATASGNSVIRLWRMPAGRPLGPPLYEPPEVTDISLSPDGRTLAITRDAMVNPPGVTIVDVATRRPLPLPGSETVYELARFTSDGRYVVGASWRGWVQLWSTDTWRPVGRRLGGRGGTVLWESMSPDDSTLATGSPEGTIRLWDVASRQPLGAPLPGIPNRSVVPQFTPDGAYLFAITNAGRGYRWDVRWPSLVRHACAVAGRPLTRAEWDQALPSRGYAPACNR